MRVGWGAVGRDGDGNGDGVKRFELVVRMERGSYRPDHPPGRRRPNAARPDRRAARSERSAKEVDTAYQKETCRGTARSRFRSRGLPPDLQR